MQSFTFHAPTYFAFGRASEQEAGPLVKRFGGSKVLLHYGRESIKKHGIYDKVKTSLTQASLEVVELGGVQPNPRSGLVYQGIDLCRKEQVDFILAVGGGSVIDSAKAIAVGVPYAGDFWDFFTKKEKVTQALNVGTVLTLAAAGSEGSTDSVITHEDGSHKRGAGGDALRPCFSILNPEFTLTLPAYQTACGLTDMMAHICERYFTRTPHVETTDRLCEGLMVAIRKEGLKVMANPLDYDARANVMWAGMLAHNNICGVGREQDWSSHLMEHELSAKNDVSHGAGLAVILPAWMTYVMGHDPMLFARFAVRVWGCEMNFTDPRATARQGIQRFRAFLKHIGMPLTLSEIGLGAQDIPGFVARLTAGGKTLGRFVTLGVDDIQAIYELAL